MRRAGGLWRGRLGARLSVLGPTVGRQNWDAEQSEEVDLLGLLTLCAGIEAGCEIAVADLGHPAGTCQVAVDELASPLRVLAGVDAENEPGNFVVADALLISIEKTDVGLVMLVVVFGNAVGPGDLVGDLRMGIGFGHRYPLPLHRNHEVPAP